MIDQHTFRQVAWVVDDLDTAMRQWIDSGLVGPFLAFRHTAQVRYRGGPASLDISIGLAQLGDSQLELIQPHGDGPSVYRDTVPLGQPGLHHIGRFTDDLDVELERHRAAGDLVAVEGAPTELLRFAYVNTRASIGCMTEYFEWAGAEPLRALFEAVADAAHNWDGSDPIRRLPGLTG